MAGSRQGNSWSREQWGVHIRKSCHVAFTSGTHDGWSLTRVSHVMYLFRAGPAKPAGTTRDSCSAADVNTITKSLYPCDQISQFSSRAHHAVIILFQQWFHWPQGCIVRVYASVLPAIMLSTHTIPFFYLIIINFHA